MVKHRCDQPPEQAHAAARLFPVNLIKRGVIMIGKLLGALIGAEVEKKRQESGLKGAVLGMAAVGLAKRLAPAALLLGGAYAAKKYYDRSRDAQSPAAVAAS